MTASGLVVHVRYILNNIISMPLGINHPIKCHRKASPPVISNITLLPPMTSLPLTNMMDLIGRTIYVCRISLVDLIWGFRFVFKMYLEIEFTYISKTDAKRSRDAYTKACPVFVLKYIVLADLTYYKVV